MNSLDMTELLSEAYSLADRINESKEVSRYLELKRALAEDEEARKLINRFQTKKELFAEAQRFGHFHPDYHRAKDEAKEYLAEIRKYPLIKEYLELEEILDQLLNGVSQRIANAVSEDIKVPVNDEIQAMREANQKRRKSCG
ncbi:Cell fate regulator YlbF, YheA/YmcA/DUF963 family (controls sporulation, competence, biofilm development) [Marininema mesophilum]|uniref:Cell fate regulator YlbF, YheA/YmcA/DUF963 family (Controls sporulation, competence, biofilm development) n=1 Tax=Marininema mesophilum TaxID=1048340 RepID=A0A1H2VJL8_9BACL|nr:YlbF family regulator [Marininema mesophilum]SDW68541.1 Cell fate regulator YlbF, YheA/YmcA/DUF963 family (controls sporulation, competence, biofilm development) [Marininema mesophilum]